jgi:diguanylate cyclase (GGDEF)-like protein
MQILCADYGRIVFRDDYNGIEKLFELGEPCSDDFELVKDNLYYENEGIYVNTTEDNLYSYMLQDGRKSLLFLPMFEKISAGDQSAFDDTIYENEIGYIYLESSKVLNNFNDENFEKCRLMVNLVKAVLENYRLKILSTVDKLTGVYLRKYTEERFSAELMKARRDNHELSVIMCDIDKFKHVNDTYGHLKGDEILRQIGAILNEFASNYGFVGRYGGEEFFMVLPKMSLSETYNISEAIRRQVQEEIRVEARKPVTISLGISSYPHHGLSEEALIENADKALYYSKNTGRNKSTKWSKEISGDHYRFNRLAGILTGNSAVDATNMQSIVEIISMLKQKLDKNGKLLKVLENLIDITKADMAYIVECRENGDYNTYMKERGTHTMNMGYKPNKELVAQFINSKTGDYFVNWDAIPETDQGDKMPNWKSIIVSPLFNGERSKGIVVVEVPIIEREFDFNNYNYVNLMSGLISAII